MIEMLLKRIAQRAAPRDANALKAQTLLSEQHVFKNSAADGLAGSEEASQAWLDDPFGAGDDAPQQTSPHTGQTLPGMANAWQVAALAYLQAGPAVRLDGQPAYFKHWGQAHVALAQLIWSEREAMNENLSHVLCGNHLLAVVDGSKMSFAIHPEGFNPNTPLHWQRAKPKKPDAASQSEDGHHVHLHTLMWFLGQIYAPSVDWLPQELGSSRIQLRRFPQVPPAAMAMRHLALLHQFSRGAMSFARLERSIEPAHRHFLCADLTSLFLSNTMRLLPPLPRTQVA
jgi:hypothetical protein